MDFRQDCLGNMRNARDVPRGHIRDCGINVTWPYNIKGRLFILEATGYIHRVQSVRLLRNMVVEVHLILAGSKLAKGRTSGYAMIALKVIIVRDNASVLLPF
jgi:hypothetical protein